MLGEWEQDSTWNEPERYRLRLPPVFDAAVFFRDGWWQATLNNIVIGQYPSPELAKARCDWEVWNRLRQVREPYTRVLARRTTWETGWQ